MGPKAPLPALCRSEEGSHDCLNLLVGTILILFLSIFRADTDMMGRVERSMNIGTSAAVTATVRSSGAL